MGTTADALSVEPGPRPNVWMGLAGAAVAAAVIVPITPDGVSVLGIVLDAFRDGGVLAAMSAALAFGTPFAFGLLVSGSAFLGRDDPGAELALRLAQQGVLAMLHVHLVYFAARMAWAGMGLAPLALLGFSLTGGLYFAYRSALTRAASEHDRGPDLRWMARWGAAMVAPLASWCRLQMLVGVRLGLAVEILLVGSLAILLLAQIEDR